MSDLEVSSAALDLGTEWAELCHAHGIPQEWIAASRSVDELVAEVIEQCERRLLRPDGAAFEADTDGHDGVRGLLAFVRKAAALRERGTGPSAQLVSTVAGLERIRNGSPGADERTAELLVELGGLCHQINNPLTSLMGRVQILRMKPDSDAAAVHRALAVIEESARRVAAHVQELGHLVGRERERLLSRS